MDQSNGMKRDEWKSRLGFMLAAMGSAVGLGNIWRFSYVAGENGGATFLLIYIFFILAFGIPLLLTEFSIGKAGKKMLSVPLCVWLQEQSGIGPVSWV